MCHPRELGLTHSPIKKCKCCAFYDLPLLPPPHIYGEDTKSGQTGLWIPGNIYWQERTEIAIPSHHRKLPRVTLSIVNCYVARQQVAEEAPSRERWIKDTIAYTPLERITNETPKEHERFHKIRTGILAAQKEFFSSDILPSNAKHVKMRAYVVPLGDAAQTSKPRVKRENNDFTLPLYPHNSGLLLQSWPEFLQLCAAAIHPAHPSYSSLALSLPCPRQSKSLEDRLYKCVICKQIHLDTDRCCGKS